MGAVEEDDSRVGQCGAAAETREGRGIVDLESWRIF